MTSLIKTYRHKIISSFLALMLCGAILITGCGNKSGHSMSLAKTNIDNKVVVAWNEAAYTIANQHDQFYSFIGVRALTMVHLAMHDALNAIDARYEQYAYNGRDANADAVTAISTAACDVLLSVYPKRQDTIQTIYNAWMATVPEGKPKALGIALGKKSAATILKMRKNDGHQANGDYTPMTKPGDYQYTPQFEGYVWKPDFSRVKPFSLDSLTQFRSPPPPDLRSPAYAASYNEVKLYGVRNSKVRSADQTQYAHWWAEFAEHGWNRIGRITASERNLSLWETARMFALINMDLYDIYLVSFDSKYFYDTWRPYTAIRHGDTDGNPETKPDPDWEPEMLTPPWPEYPSAHAAVAAGGAEVVSHVYNSPDISFSMESTTAGPEFKTRTYANLESAANDCANSRIMNGFHFRFATEEGKRQGRKAAQHLIANYLRPL